MNQIASNPWIIDTPSDTGPLYAGNMPHVQIEFVDYTDPSHLAEVQDRNGRTIAFLRGALDFSTVRTGRMGWMYGVLVPTTTIDRNGVRVPNLQSGRIVLYFE